MCCWGESGQKLVTVFSAGDDPELNLCLALVAIVSTTHGLHQRTSLACSTTLVLFFSLSRLATCSTTPTGYRLLLAAHVCGKEMPYDIIAIVCAKGAMMKTILSLAVVGMLLVTPTAMTAFAASKSRQQAEPSGATERLECAGQLVRLGRVHAGRAPRRAPPFDLPHTCII